MKNATFKTRINKFKNEIDNSENIHQLNVLNVEFNWFMRENKLCLIGFEDRWDRLEPTPYF